MKKILPNFSSSSVLVVGDVMLDKYWITKEKGFLDDLSNPILKIYKRYNYVGGAANVAKNVSSLGGKSILVGVVGKDDDSKIIQKILKDANVKYLPVVEKNHITTTKLRIISEEKQFVRIDCEKKIKNNIITLLSKKIIQFISSVSILILSDYNKGALNSIEDIIKIAKKNNTMVLVDPKGKDFSKYFGSTLLTPNLFEFERIVGKCFNRRDIFEKGMRLLEDLELQALLVTQSQEGMTLLQKKKKPIHFLTCANQVKDVTGAGDTVISVLALGLASGCSLEKSCYQANIAAGIVVKKPGTATLNIEELRTAMKLK